MVVKDALEQGMVVEVVKTEKMVNVELGVELLVVLLVRMLQNAVVLGMMPLEVEVVEVVIMQGHVVEILDVIAMVPQEVVVEPQIGRAHV